MPSSSTTTTGTTDTSDPSPTTPFISKRNRNLLRVDMVGTRVGESGPEVVELCAREKYNPGEQ